MSASREEVDALTKALVDKGFLIEAGWKSYELLVLSPAAPQIQRDECRLAFFAGTQHLFSSMMAMLDPGSEPTASDMKRMYQITSELEAFATVFAAQHGVER